MFINNTTGVLEDVLLRTGVFRDVTLLLGKWLATFRKVILSSCLRD